MRSLPLLDLPMELGCQCAWYGGQPRPSRSGLAKLRSNACQIRLPHPIEPDIPKVLLLGVGEQRNHG